MTHSHIISSGVLFSFAILFFHSHFLLLFFSWCHGTMRHAQVQHAQQRVPCHVFVESQSCTHRYMAQVFEIVLTCCGTDQHERGSRLAALWMISLPFGNWWSAAGISIFSAQSLYVLIVTSTASLGSSNSAISSTWSLQMPFHVRQLLNQATTCWPQFDLCACLTKLNNQATLAAGIGYSQCCLARAQAKLTRKPTWSVPSIVCTHSPVARTFSLRDVQTSRTRMAQGCEKDLLHTHVVDVHLVFSILMFHPPSLLFPDVHVDTTFPAHRLRRALPDP